MPDALHSASGRWPELLTALAGLSAEQLSNRHQPCPACAVNGVALGHGRNVDRYRWDRDDGPGGWFCNQCGGKDGRGGAGSGIDLLMRVRGWSLPEACQAVERHLGLPAPPSTSSKKRSKPHRIPDQPPTDAPPPRLGKAVAQWCYRDSSGAQLFWIQRFDLPDRRKLFLHRVWLDGDWHYPSRRDPFTSEWPAPRPLYRLPDLAAKPDAPVLVVEGEKAADAAALFLPDWVVLSWPNGSKAIAQIDWQPLSTRSVLLWPDADDPGRQAMASLAARLLQLRCEVQVVQPPSNVATGWDLADALAESWTTKQVLAVIAKFAKPIEAPPPDPDPPEASEPAAEAADAILITPQNSPYTLLGFDNDCYFYQPHSTGQVIKVRRSAHTGTNLVAIAPMRYWEALFPGKAGPNWTMAASTLFESQAAVGVYAPDRIRGRGAWWDQGRAVLHLGNRLIIDGLPQPVNTTLPGSDAIYQRLAALRGPVDDPLPTELSSIVCELASRFHWEVPASGLLMAGWVTLAPICGALDWRPHAWLTGSSGSGKSELLRNFVQPLLGDMSLHVVGATTEAGIRQQLRADAIPVVFDESESNERNDQARIQSVLGLARVSSSESGAFTLKGSADGDAQRFLVRSMFLLSSIATSLKQGADLGRFAQLSLRSTKDMPQQQRAEHWDALLRDLHQHITPNTGRRLQARTISLIPTIRQSVQVFTRVAAAYFNSQRLGDQYGTLLAGAWSLGSTDVPTEDEAWALIRANDWQPYSSAAEIPDELRCIRRILQHQIRVEASSRVLTRSIGELVALALSHDTDADITAKVARDHLGRHGIRADADAIAVSNTADAIGRILQETAWANCWPAILSRLPGASRTSSAIRFAGTGATARAVLVPVTALDQAD